MGDGYSNGWTQFPSRFYQELDQYSRVIADPEAIQKLLEYPGLRRIWVNPQIIEIERDPEIVSDLRRGDILGVFTNRKVAALLKDPQLRKLFDSGRSGCRFPLRVNFARQVRHSSADGKHNQAFPCGSLPPTVEIMAQVPHA